MKKLKFIKNIFTYGQNKILNFSILFFLGCNQAFAMGMDQGGDMPWEGPLQKIMDSLTGPGARILAVLVIVMAGFGIAFGESGSGVRRLLQIVMGLAIVFGAASIVASLFGGDSSGIAI